MKNLNIGDKITFLDSVGGGIVVGFSDKNMILVEDEDGFEMPVEEHQCVLVEKAKQKSISKDVNSQSGEITTDAGSIGKVDFKPSFNENKDQVNIYFAFRRKYDDKLKSKLELFLINDSAYNLFYTISKIDSGLFNLCNKGELGAYSLFAIDCINASEVEKYSKISFQSIVFKRDKSFVGKNSINVEKNIKIRSLFSDDAFVKTDYFDEKINLIPLYVEKKSLSSLDLKKQELIEEKTKSISLPKVKIVDKIDLSSFKNKSRFRTPKRVRKEYDIIEVDLHINNLLDTTSGMNNADMLQYQMDIFNYTIKSKLRRKGQKIIFIHGKGDGVLRSKILKELQLKYPNCKSQDAPFSKYGYGATMVIIG